MKINVAYDSSVASAPAEYKAAIAAAVLFVEKAFVSDITVNLTFAWGPIAGGSAQSLSSYETVSYASVIAALKTAATGNPLLAGEVLPATDPFTGTSMTITTAEARQLGLDAGAPPTDDSVITLGTAYPFNLNPSVGATPGTINGVSALIHEITEALGRQCGSDGALMPSAMALFRYAAPGQIDISQAADGYLSLNGGQTNLGALGNTGGDLADFNIQNEVYGIPVYDTPISVSQVDVQDMEALGYNATSGVNFGGGANVTMNAGDNNAAVFFNSNGTWDAATGSSGAVLLWNDQASVVGGGDTVTFYAGLATATDEASLYNTSNNWDVVNGSNGIVVLTGSQASVVGADDAIYFNGSGASAVSLYATAGGWDSVTGSNGVVALSSAQASLVGGADQIYLDGSTSDAVSLYATNNAWDTVTGSNGTVILTTSQASVVGGADQIAFNGGGDTVSLYNTAGAWDTVTGSNGVAILSSAQASVVGGGDIVYFLAATADAVSLYNTAGVWDTVTGSNGWVALTSAQASIAGGGNQVFLAGAGAIASLYATGASADAVTASNATLDFTNASANLTGGGDTLGFLPAFGQDTIGGYVASDVLAFSKTDWTSYAALVASKDMTQVGGDTQIRLDTADVLILKGVTASSLTAANFSFT